MSVSAVLTVVVCAWVGIDVAKAKLDVVVHVGQEKHHRIFANTLEGFALLHAWLCSLPVARVRICCEATGSYSDALTRFLWAHHYELSVLNPAVLVAFRKTEQVRTKTDKMDAELLARYGEKYEPPLTVPVSEEVEELRRLLARRDDLLSMRSQEENRLEAGRVDAWTTAQIEAHIALLEQQYREVEKRLRSFLAQSQQVRPIWQRLQSIPGIGWFTAALVLSIVGDIQRFRRASSLVSLAGLSVKLKESGSSVHAHPQIDRHGVSRLRRALYWCAITAMRHDPQIAAWAGRLQARHKPKKVVIVAVMRKLLHLIYGVWKHEQVYDPAKVLGPVV